MARHFHRQLGLCALLVSLLATCAIAATTVVLEQTHNKQLPEGWKFHSNASSSDRIKISIALRESGIADLKDHLQRQWQYQSDESSQRHLTSEEVARYRAPNPAAVNAVSGWLRSSGISNYKFSGGSKNWITFEASVQTVKSLFGADLAYYSFESSSPISSELPRREIPPSKPVLRALSYSVPTWLRHEIDLVHPLTNFMVPRSHHNAHHANQVELLRRDRLLKKRSMRATSHSAEKPAPPPPPEEDFPWNPDSPLGDPYETGTDMPCFTGTFPECIRILYNISYAPSLLSPSPSSASPPSPTASSSPNTSAPSAEPKPAAIQSPSRFGIAGFLEQWIMYADVEAFLATYAPEIPFVSPPLSSPSLPESSTNSSSTPSSSSDDEGYTFSVHLLEGAINPQDSIYNAGMEASLDVEYAISLGYPAQVTYYITGGRGTKLDQNGTALSEEESDNEPYLEFLENLLALPDAEIPHVLSISYADDEKGVPRAYALRVCDLFAALTARGVSVFVATGDGGAAGTAQTSCVTNDGTNRKQFVPTFPASCPWVTAIGATDNYGPPLKGADFSTGGFSNYFDMPLWQLDTVGPVVQKLVDNKDERLEWVNITGRAIPDISAVGAGYQIVFGGRTIEVLGTSASTPVIAAMVALVNDKRLREGRRSVGWLTPKLYTGEMKKILRDVVHGESLGCAFPNPDGGGGNQRSRGWETQTGYDLVTGLGTVDDFWDFMGILSK